jgi:hypothetical protein
LRRLLRSADRFRDAAIARASRLKTEGSRSIASLVWVTRWDHFFVALRFRFAHDGFAFFVDDAEVLDPVF